METHRCRDFKAWHQSKTRVTPVLQKKKKKMFYVLAALKENVIFPVQAI
jgi:hypothetical protein